MPNFQFLYNRRVKDAGIIGPRIVRYKNFTGAQNIRRIKSTIDKRFGSVIDTIHVMLRNYKFLKTLGTVNVFLNSGWHFNSIGNYENYKEKLDSFSHIEYKNDSIYKHENMYQEELKNNADFIALDELPEFIQKNFEKFSKFISV